MPIMRVWNGLIVLCEALLLIGLNSIALYGAEGKEVDTKARSILEKASAYYQGLENFRAIYNLTVKYPEEEEVHTSKMCITVQGQQYKLCYFQKEIITDGETIWEYDKEFKEVTISEYDKTDCTLNFAELHNLYQQGYTFMYVGERMEVYKKQNTIRDIIQLTPSQDSGDFLSITLEIDRSTSQIRKWEIIQNEETKYVCTMINLFTNIPLADNYFVFDLTKHGDAEVIDLRENEGNNESNKEE